jgi:uncharacterized protein (TIGR02646 family)
MRKLAKTVLPPELIERIQEWQQELTALVTAGTPVPDGLRTRYRHPDLKNPLLAETFGKCAYCESKVTAVYPGDVEHILPKTARPDLTFDYANLTLACFICNNRKGDYYNVAQPLLHPYEDDPGEHLVAAGPLIKHRAGATKGHLTETMLQLNRTGLVERRRDRIEGIMALADLYVNEPIGPLKAILREQLLEETDKSKEYSFAVAAFISVICDLE